jgi:hypothetical protein
MSATEKASLERSLKTNVDGFIAGAALDHWDAIYPLTVGFDSSDVLREELRKSWPQKFALTGGEVASMSWVGSKTAKVKVVWAFRTDKVMSYSGETFVWILKGTAWKCQGRAIR